MTAGMGKRGGREAMASGRVDLRQGGRGKHGRGKGNKAMVREGLLRTRLAGARFRAFFPGRQTSTTQLYTDVQDEGECLHGEEGVRGTGQLRGRGGNGGKSLPKADVYAGCTQCFVLV